MTFTGKCVERGEISSGAPASCRPPPDFSYLSHHSSPGCSRMVLPAKSGDEVNVPSQMINLEDALTRTSRYYAFRDR